MLLLRTVLSLLLVLRPAPPADDPPAPTRRLLRGHHHRPTPPPPPPSASLTPSIPVPVLPVHVLPPASPPSLPPSPSSSPFPKYPSSSLPTPSTPTTTMPFTTFPFFPSLPSPPPPPGQPASSSSSSSSQPTFPANVSALPTEPRPAPSGRNVLPTILLPLLSVSLLGLLLSLLLVHLHRRRKDRGAVVKNARSDSVRLFPPPPPSTSNPSTEFLYLGTLVSPRGTSQPLDPGTSNDVGGGGGVETGGAASPELRPLPPLPRQLGCSHGMSGSFDGSAPSSVSGVDMASTSVSSSLPTSSSPTRFSRSSKESETWGGGAGRDTELRPPPIPPPPATLLRRPNSNPGMQRSEQQPKLKPLFWDKVPSSSSRVMAWDRLKSGSFQLNEEMIQSLFGSKTAANNGTGKQFNVNNGVGSAGEEKLLVMDQKKSHNIAILLKALNVSKEQVCEALREGNIANIGSEVLEALMRMSPTKDEESKLKEYRDGSPFKLGSAESFMKAVIDVPFAFQRVDAMLFMANFDHEVSYLKGSFGILEEACNELRNCRLFHKLLDAVLKTGNRINLGTHRGDAKAFKLDTLLKLADIKSNDGKTTLLHFIIHEVIKSEKLAPQFINSLESELAGVKKASSIDPDELTLIVSKLSNGIGKVRNVIQLNQPFLGDERALGFHSTVSAFLQRAELEISKIQDQENVALSSVRDTAEFFHGDSASEDSEPFRIFVVVRDFLAILNDKICKESGLNEFVVRNNACQIPVNADRIPSLI